MFQAEESQRERALEKVSVARGLFSWINIEGHPIRVALLVLSGIPVFALMISMAYDTYHEFRDDTAAAYQTASTIRSISTARTELFLANANFVLSELSRRSLVQALDALNCDPELAAVKKRQPAYANLLTLDAKGRLVCSAAGIAPGPVAGPDPRYYFDEVVRTRKFTVGKPARGFITGRWVSTLAYPLLNDAGQLKGVVAIAVDLVNYQPVIDLEDAPARTVVGIFNSEGTLIARSDDATTRIGTVSEALASRLMRAQVRGTLRSLDYQGVERYYAFAPIANSDWTTFVSLDEATVLAPVRRLVYQRLALMIALIAVVAAIARMVAQRIAGPVEAISRTMARVGGGAIHERAPMAGPSELRQIAAQLNSTLDLRLQAEADLRRSEESLKEAQRIARIGSYTLDFSSGRWESSDELDRLFGITPRFERSVQSWESLIHPADRATMDGYFKSQVVGQHQTFDKEYRIIRRNDQAERWMHGLGRLKFDAQGGLQKMIGTIQDITERKQADSRIEALAFTDHLTGLPNRRLLMDRLEQALAAGARHGRQDALLFIDLDDFKSLNDTLGHDKGDSLLRQIGQRLTSCVREGDTVARLGGDEFVVVLGDLSGIASEAAAQAQAVTAKILNALGQPYDIEGHGYHSTCSIGITLFGGATRERIEEPLKRAEMAMYQAKAAGRNTLRFFEPEMGTAVTTRAALEAELREAVSSGQFVLHYQPQGGGSVRMSGVEALLRWQHPRRGLVSPAEFVSIAETNGLILPLGRWVLETACKQLAAWAARPEMSHLTMAVNVSARQFRQPDFVEAVMSILRANGAKPSRLKLELTESVLVDNVEDIIVKMNDLRAKGVGFSLDDFGTGYSSLSYLKRLPLDQLKIDRSFVKDIITDPDDAAIAKMVIALADSLGLLVIAEGVETEAQRDFLAGLGCNNYQGYLFSRPLPIDELEAFVNRI